MIDSTNSFKNIKKQQQEIWNFALLISHSIPTLKKNIKAVNENIPNYSIPNPDYFKPKSDLSRLSAIIPHYKSNLSKYIILSLFSYFEDYFKSVMKEMVEYHGGKDIFLDTIKSKHTSFISNINPALIKDIRKLQEPYVPNKKQKYVKHTKQLLKQPDFRFPSELFSVYGLKMLINEITSDELKSFRIPFLLSNAFLMDLSIKPNKQYKFSNLNIEQTFDSFRKMRNRIAHGSAVAIDLKKVSAYSEFIRDFTVRIDKHLLNNFFIQERY